MNRFRFIENDLCCDVYYDKSRDTNDLALFLYGFPATIGENELTIELVKRGYMVLQPHYFGTYDSAGNFTPEAAFKSVKSIVDTVKKAFVKNLKNNKETKLPDRISLCVGYSFGAFVLRHTMKYLVDVENVILLSPVMSSNPCNQLCWTTENASEHLQYVLRTRPYTYRIVDTSSWIKEYVNDENSLPSLPNNKVKKVAWIIGKQDDTIILAEVMNRYEKVTNDFIGSSSKSEMIVVEKGGHGVSTLINQYTMKKLDDFLGLQEKK